MAWEDLSSEEQGIVQEYVRQQRAIVGEFARVLSAVDDMKVKNDAIVADILNGLDGGLVIPDQSGLSGVSPLTVSDVQTMSGNFETVLATYRTPQARQIYVRFAGLTNTIRG